MNKESKDKNDAEEKINHNVASNSRCKNTICSKSKRLKQSVKCKKESCHCLDKDVPLGKCGCCLEKIENMSQKWQEEFKRLRQMWSDHHKIAALTSSQRENSYAKRCTYENKNCEPIRKEKKRNCLKTDPVEWKVQKTKLKQKVVLPEISGQKANFCKKNLSPKFMLLQRNQLKDSNQSVTQDPEVMPSTSNSSLPHSSGHDNEKHPDKTKIHASDELPTDVQFKYAVSSNSNSRKRQKSKESDISRKSYSKLDPKQHYKLNDDDPTLKQSTKHGKSPEKSEKLNHSKQKSNVSNTNEVSKLRNIDSVNEFECEVENDGASRNKQISKNRLHSRDGVSNKSKKRNSSLDPADKRDTSDIEPEISVRKITNTGNLRATSDEINKSFKKLSKHEEILGHRTSLVDSARAGNEYDATCIYDGATSKYVSSSENRNTQNSRRSSSKNDTQKSTIKKRSNEYSPKLKDTSDEDREELAEMSTHRKFSNKSPYKNNTNGTKENVGDLHAKYRKCHCSRKHLHVSSADEKQLAQKTILSEIEADVALRGDDSPKKRFDRTRVSPSDHLEDEASSLAQFDSSRRHRTRSRHSENENHSTKAPGSISASKLRNAKTSSAKDSSHKTRLEESMYDTSIKCDTKDTFSSTPMKESLHPRRHFDNISNQSDQVRSVLSNVIQEMDEPSNKSKQKGEVSNGNSFRHTSLANKSLGHRPAQRSHKQDSLNESHDIDFQTNERVAMSNSRITLKNSYEEKVPSSISKSKNAQHDKSNVKHHNYVNSPSSRKNSDNNKSKSNRKSDFEEQNISKRSTKKSNEISKYEIEDIDVKTHISEKIPSRSYNGNSFKNNKSQRQSESYNNTGIIEEPSGYTSNRKSRVSSTNSHDVNRTNVLVPRQSTVSRVNDKSEHEAVNTSSQSSLNQSGNSDISVTDEMSRNRSPLKQIALNLCGTPCGETSKSKNLNKTQIKTQKFYNSKLNKTAHETLEMPDKSRDNQINFDESIEKVLSKCNPEYEGLEYTKLSKNHDKSYENTSKRVKDNSRREKLKNPYYSNQTGVQSKSNLSFRDVSSVSNNKPDVNENNDSDISSYHTANSKFFRNNSGSGLPNAGSLRNLQPSLEPISSTNSFESYDSHYNKLKALKKSRDSDLKTMRNEVSQTDHPSGHLYHENKANDQHDQSNYKNKSKSSRTFAGGHRYEQIYFAHIFNFKSNSIDTSRNDTETSKVCSNSRIQLAHHVNEDYTSGARKSSNDTAYLKRFIYKNKSGYFSSKVKSLIKYTYSRLGKWAHRRDKTKFLAEEMLCDRTTFGGNKIYVDKDETEKLGQLQVRTNPKLHICNSDETKPENILTNTTDASFPTTSTKLMTVLELNKIKALLSVQNTTNNTFGKKIHNLDNKVQGSEHKKVNGKSKPRHYWAHFFKNKMQDIIIFILVTMDIAICLIKFYNSSPPPESEDFNWFW